MKRTGVLVLAAVLTTAMAPGLSRAQSALQRLEAAGVDTACIHAQRSWAVSSSVRTLGISSDSAAASWLASAEKDKEFLPEVRTWLCGRVLAGMDTLSAILAWGPPNESEPDALDPLARTWRYADGRSLRIENGTVDEVHEHTQWVVRIEGTFGRRFAGILTVTTASGISQKKVSGMAPDRLHVTGDAFSLSLGDTGEDGNFVVTVERNGRQVARQEASGKYTAVIISQP